MKKTAKKIITSVLAVTTILGTGLSLGVKSLTRLSPLVTTASAEETEKNVIVDGVTYNYRMGQNGLEIISADGNFPDDYSVPEKLDGINVGVICSNAFEGKEFKTIRIPKNVILCSYSFYNTIMDSIYFANGVTVDDWAINFKSWVFPCSILNKAYFDENTTKIPNGILAGATNLEKVEFSEKVIVIGDHAFSGCKNLESINDKYLSNLVEIGSFAFEGTGYSSFIAPRKLVSIGDYAFANTKVKKIDLGSIKKLGAYAFAGCNNIEEVTVPSTLKDGFSLGSDAFLDCSNLKTVYFNANETEEGNLISWGAYDSGHSNVFAGSAVAKVIFGSNVSHIPHNAFDSYDRVSALKEIHFTCKIEKIDDNAFYGCSSIEEIFFPGTKAEWDNVVIGYGNEALDNATIHFNESNFELKKDDEDQTELSLWQKIVNFFVNIINFFKNLFN